jgi:hypothetical protein
MELMLPILGLIDKMNGIMLREDLFSHARTSKKERNG